MTTPQDPPTDGGPDDDWAHHVVSAALHEPAAHQAADPPAGGYTVAPGDRDPTGEDVAVASERTVEQSPADDERTVEEDTVDEDTVDEDTVDEDTVDEDTVDEDTVDEDTVDEDTVDEDTVDEDTVDEDTVVEEDGVDEDAGDGFVPWRHLGVTVVAIVVAGAVARLAYLGLRPLHHDESLDAWFSWRFLNGTYEGYDPVYHGPLRFYVTAAFYWLFGVSDGVARLLPALCGSAVVGLPWVIRRQLGNAGTIAACLAIAVSPSMLYFSRFGREDATFLLISTGFALVLLAFFLAPREWHPVALMLLLVAGWAVKESVFIMIFLMGSFVLSLVAQQLWWAARGRPQFGPRRGDPPWIVAAGIVAMVVAFGVGEPIFVSLGLYGLLVVALLVSAALQARSAGVGVRDVPVLRSLVAVPFGMWAIAAAVAAFVFAALFTVFFSTLEGADTDVTRWNALVDGLRSGFEYWRGEQDTVRGDSRWFYYLAVIPLYEWFFLLFAVLGAWRVATRRSLIGWFFLWLAVTSVAAYSWAGERMPWLIIHPLLPILVLAGYGAQQLWEWRRHAVMPFVAAAALVGLVFTVYTSAMASYVRGDEPRELFVQAGQTHEDVPHWVDRTADLDRLTRSELGRPLQLAIDAEYAWPYVWSLRDREGVTYPALGTDSGPFTPDVVISSWPNADLTRSRLPADTAYVEIPYVHRVWWVPDYSTGRFGGWLDWVLSRDTWGGEANGPGNFPGTVFVNPAVFQLEQRWEADRPLALAPSAD